jgi:hypothetical protein
VAERRKAGRSRVLKSAKLVLGDGGYSIRPCRLVWRTVTETGVEFVQAA